MRGYRGWDLWGDGGEDELVGEDRGDGLVFVGVGCVNCALELVDYAQRRSSIRC